MNQTKIQSFKTLIPSPKLTVSVQSEVKTLVLLGVMTIDEAIIMFANN